MYRVQGVSTCLIMCRSSETPLESVNLLQMICVPNRCKLDVDSVNIMLWRYSNNISMEFAKKKKKMDTSQ